MTTSRKTILYMAMSLDGYIADQHGGVNWLGGAEGEGDNGYSDFYKSVDTILMGRTTYDQIMSFGCDWPYSDKQCYVFTSKKPNANNHVEFISDDISRFMKSIKSQQGSNIWLVGGAKLTTSFLKEELIDEFMIAVIPIILGQGKPLFKSGIPRTALVLKNQLQFKNIVLLHYARK